MTKKVLLDILKNKDGEFNIRDMASAIFLIVVIIVTFVHIFTQYNVDQWLYITMVGIMLGNSGLYTLDKRISQKVREEVSNTKSSNNDS